MEYVLEQLRSNPTLTYADIRRTAQELGMTVPPILYGRAKLQLGIPAAPLRQEVRPNWPAAAAPAAPTAVAESASAATSDAEAEATAVAIDTRPDLVRPQKKSSPAFEFTTDLLRQEPKIAYAEVKARAVARGLNVPPILYGRAKAFLGLVPTAPRGSKKLAKATASAAAAAPRVLRQVDSSSRGTPIPRLPMPALEHIDNLEQLVTTVKEIEGERRRLRELLQRMMKMIAEALA